MSGLSWVCIFVVVEIFTTAGILLSSMFAKEGNGRPSTSSGSPADTIELINKLTVKITAIA
jgi:hypothetical protein